MSFRHVKVTQGMKGQAAKSDSFKYLRDSSSSSSSSSKQTARCFSSSASESSALRATENEKLKQAEESLRTIMYLSCWGPN